MLGICIKFFHHNYGGMLQSYATVRLLSNYCEDYELIRYIKKKNLDFYIHSVPRLFNPVLIADKKLVFSKKVNSFIHRDFKKNEESRRQKFDEFVREHFTSREKRIYGYDELCKNAANYDIILTGSDQLWSPSGLETNFFNLMFVPDGTRKVSLCSSFGVHSIPHNQIERTREYLNRIPFISTREKRGAEIVYELTGKSVPILLDPAFTLGKAQWESVACGDKICDHDYVFAYLLGNNVAHRDEIEKYATDRNLKIITLRHANQYVARDESFGDISPYAVGPREFLSLIRDAKAVFTDSYHGCVFSIIFHREFAVFDRYDSKSASSKNSRIDTLCDTFNLGNRRRSQGRSIADIMSDRLDFAETDLIIQNGNDRIHDYLDEAFKNE